MLIFRLNLLWILALFAFKPNLCSRWLVEVYSKAEFSGFKIQNAIVIPLICDWIIVLVPPTLKVSVIVIKNISKTATFLCYIGDKWMQLASIYTAWVTWGPASCCLVVAALLRLNRRGDAVNLTKNNENTGVAETEWDLRRANALTAGNTSQRNKQQDFFCL